MVFCVDYVSMHTLYLYGKLVTTLIFSWPCYFHGLRFEMKIFIGTAINDNLLIM